MEVTAEILDLCHVEELIWTVVLGDWCEIEHVSYYVLVESHKCSLLLGRQKSKDPLSSNWQTALKETLRNTGTHSHVYLLIFCFTHMAEDSILNQTAQYIELHSCMFSLRWISQLIKSHTNILPLQQVFSSGIFSFNEAEKRSRCWRNNQC